MIFLISFSSSKSSLRILKSSLTFILPSVQFSPFEFIINSYRTFSTTNEIQSTDKLSFRFHATVDEISTKQRIYRNISQPRFYHARNTGTIGIQREDWLIGYVEVDDISGLFPALFRAHVTRMPCQTSVERCVFDLAIPPAQTLLHKGCTHVALT